MTDGETNNPITKRVAAVDLGTNSFHAVLVDVYRDGSFRTIDKLKEMVALAEKGMDNHLSEDAMTRGLEALKRIKFLCDSQQVEQILAFATSAIREADNGGRFIQRIIDEVGIKARAIPGKMEAELIGTALRHSISLDEDMVLMVDIGGGSVEFIVGNKKEFVHLSSLKIGVARMAARFVSSDPIKESEIKEVRRHFESQLEEVKAVLKEYPVKTIIGSSGTMENIAAMIVGEDSGPDMLTLNELAISSEAFQIFYSDFIQLNRKKRSKIKGLEEKRIDIINPGMVLVKYLVDEFAIENIRISEAALRDGMIIDFIAKEKDNPSFNLAADFPEPRKRSVYELLRKCNWQEEHSKHVAAMALQLFDALQEKLQLSETDRELLEYAALLHDIGYYISYRKHHKHALYIIRNSELRGFHEDEINIMAHVARYHRKAVPRKKHRQFGELQKDLRKRIKKLAGILRVADGLDRSHYQNVRELEIANKKKSILLCIRTEGEPELEIWGAKTKSDLLKKVTGKKVEIYAARDAS